MKFSLLLLTFLLLTTTLQAQCTANAGPDSTVCSGTSIQLGGTPAGTGGGTLSYSWAPATGLSCTNCPNPTLTATTNQTYTLTVTSSLGCTDDNSVNISIASPPTASFNFTGNNNCSNIPIQFTNTSSGTGLTYSWNFGDPGSGAQNTSNLINPTHQYNAIGAGTQNYPVTLVVTNSNGCTASFSQTVTISALPNPALIDPIAEMRNCDGSNFSMTVFDASSTNQISNYTIQWGDGSPDFNSGTFPGGGVSHNYTTAEIFSLVYTVTGNNGCVQSIPYNIANITNPAIGAANPGATTGCGPITLCFPLSNYSSNHPTTFYVVDYGDGSPRDTLSHPPPATICHTYTSSSCGQAGNQFVFRIKAINLCDSSEASISPIRVYTGPTANFNVAAVNNCVGASVLFLNTTQAGFNSACSSSTLFQWNFGDGQTLTTATATNPTHVYTAPGTYTVTLTTTNSCTVNVLTRTVCIESPPTPAFTVTPTTACIPFTAQVTNTSNLANTCNVTRVWTVLFNGSPCLPSSGAFSFAGGTNASSVNPQIQFTQPGNYTIRLTLTNSCGSFIANQAIVAQAPPQVTINGVPSVCAGLSVSPTAVVNDCLEPSDLYAWTFTGGSPTSASTLIPGAVSYTTAGTFPISLAVTNACGTTTANASVVIRPIPPALNPQVNSPVCAGSTANFTSDASPSTTYSWSGPNSFTSNQQNFNLTNVTAAQAGTYTVFGTMAGCAGPSASVTLVVNPIPVITVTPPNATICNGQSVSLTASGATTYTWSPATGLSATNTATVTANPTANQTYTVTGSNGTCSGSATVAITVNPLPVVNAGPNVNLCNQPIPFTLTPTPAGGTWTGTNVTSTGIFTPNGTGSFPLVYSFTNGNGCTNTDTLIVTVVDPTPASAGLDSARCFGSGAITLTGAPTGGTWSGTSITPAGVFTPNTVGSHALVYTFGTGTCLSRDTMIMTVNPLPLVDAGPNFSVCIDAGIQTLNGTPAGGTWSGTGITNPAGEFTPSVAGAGNRTLTYSFTNINGCTASDNLVITVNPLPVVNAGPDTTACDQPNPFQLSSSPSGGSWTGTNVSSSGLFTPNGTGSFTLTYTFTNANGCTASDPRIVTIISPTQPDAGPDFAVCIDAPNVTLSPTPAGGTWTGSFVTGSIFNPTIAGSFNLVYTLGSGACLLRDTLVALVNPLPVVNAGTDFAVCIDAGIQTLNGTPAGGTWSGTGITNPAGEFTPAVAGAGVRNLTYSFTDVNGCASSDVLAITVNPLPLVNAGNDTTLCNQPFPIQFTATPAAGTWSGTGITPSGLFTPGTVGTFNLTYTFTNGFGCTNSDIRIVTVVNPTQATAGPDLEACIDAADVQLNGTPVTGIWTGSFVSTSGLFNPTIAGTFTLVISNGAGNCLTRDTMLFTVHALPVVSVGTDEEFCPSENPVNFTGNPANGVWSGTGITDPALGTFDPGTAPVGTHTIVYTFTHPTTGCISRDSLLAVVHPMPVANFTYNPITCIGTNELFTNTSTLAAQNDWNFGDGNTSSAVNPTHGYLAAGFYDVELLVTTAFGCLDSITQQIEVRIPPVANFTLAPDSACGPMLVSFTDQSLGQTLTYDWNYGNGQTSTNPVPVAQTYQASLYTDTSYTITLNLTNFCGTSSYSEQITVMPLPTAVFGTLTDIGCTPLDLDMVNNSYGLPDTYEWIFGDGTTSNTSATTLQHTFYTGTEDTTYTIQLVVSNECGSDTIAHQITVLPPQVNAFFNIDNPMGCVPHTINLTQFSQGASFSSWDFGDGNLSSVYSPSHTFTAPGTYVVSLFAAGCGFDTTTTIVTVHPLPQIDFTSLDSVCVNQVFAFTNLSSGIASINWNFGDGTSSTLTNPSHSYAAPGFYTVTLSGISQTYGCTTQTTKVIKVNAGPASQFTLGPNAGCVELTVQMNNTSTGIVSQAWNFGDGNSSIQPNPSHTFTVAGSYAVQLIVLDNIGCADTATQVVTVYPLPTVDFTSTPVDPCVQPTVINFTNNSVNAAAYAWNFGNGLSSTLTDPSSTYQQVGDYTVSLVATTIHGCIDSIQKTVSSFQAASASFTLPTDSICIGKTIQFNATFQQTDSLYWYFGDGTVLTGTPIEYAFSSSGTYPVTLIAYGDGGCNDTVASTGSITVLQQPTANFSYENVEGPEPLSGLVAFTNLSNLADYYSWDLGNGTHSSEENPTEHYESDGEFQVTLIATTFYGCADTISKTITVDFFHGLFIPNAMSPGHSDFEVANFIPKGVGMKEFELLVYDDWGNLIWSTTALDANGRPTEHWDGTYRGEPVQQDAYVWKASATFKDSNVWEGKEYPKGRIKRSGTVTVIR